MGAGLEGVLLGEVGTGMGEKENKERLGPECVLGTLLGDWEQVLRCSTALRSVHQAQQLAIKGHPELRGSLACSHVLCARAHTNTLSKRSHLDCLVSALLGLLLIADHSPCSLYTSP